MFALCFSERILASVSRNFLTSIFLTYDKNIETTSCGVKLYRSAIISISLCLKSRLPLIFDESVWRAMPRYWASDVMSSSCSIIFILSNFACTNRHLLGVIFMSRTFKLTLLYIDTENKLLTECK